MLHAKFQDNRTSGSGEEIFKGFYHIWAWQPSWSCDLDHLYKLSSPFPRRLHIKLALIGQAVSEEKTFENGGQLRRLRRRTPEHGYTKISHMSLWLR